MTLDTLKRTVREFRDDNLTDWAAALTYYAVLSIFPALIALVSIVGLVGDSGGGHRHAHGDRDARSARPRRRTPSRARSSRSPPTAAPPACCFVVGLATAVWTASGYVGAFIRASNVIYEVEEGRPFWKLRPLQLRRHAASASCCWR